MISLSQQIVSKGDENNCMVVLKGKPKGKNKKRKIERRMKRKDEETNVGKGS